MPILNNKPELINFRKQLRNNSTSAEATLWNHLKNSQLENRKFRRQHSIENYILDFYCPSEKLAIELDGNDHFTGYGQTHDEIRDKFLNNLNIKVLRFENKAIFEGLEGILEEIKGSFNRE